MCSPLNLFEVSVFDTFCPVELWIIITASIVLTNWSGASFVNDDDEMTKKFGS
jgi:hypothetical protein